jgi:CheY-like chemotaxis protein
VVADAVEAIGPVVRAGNHRLSFTAAEQPLWVDGDSGRLMQIFENVLHNAAKYTVHDGIIDLVVTRRGASAEVSVRDNGPGIPKHMLTAIFEMFQQVDNTLDRARGGLGIGLTLARRLVELHHGTIEARSAGLGQGSEFVMTFPVAAPEPAAQQTSPASPRGALPEHCIVVVDDLPAFTDSLATLLETVGQKVWKAHDGTSAVEIARAQHPDVVLLDIGMPGIDGYETARRMRSCPELHGVTLVALTGYGQDRDREKARAAGFDHHLTKPTNLGALRELLQAAPRARSQTSNPAVASS